MMLAFFIALVAFTSTFALLPHTYPQNRWMKFATFKSSAIKAIPSHSSFLSKGLIVRHNRSHSLSSSTLLRSTRTSSSTNNGSGSKMKSSGGVKGLTEKEGARKLSKSELKAKELLEASKDPYVVRLHEKEDRFDLDKLTVGQKLRGRVISVKE